MPRHDYEVQGPDRSRRHFGDFAQAGSDDDRAGRPGRCQLDHPGGVAKPRVVVGVEPDLFNVKSLGTVDIGNRHRHKLELHIHPSTSKYWSKHEPTSRHPDHSGSLGRNSITASAGARLSRPTPSSTYPIHAAALGIACGGTGLRGARTSRAGTPTASPARLRALRTAASRPPSSSTSFLCSAWLPVHTRPAAMGCTSSRVILRDEPTASRKSSSTRSISPSKIFRSSSVHGSSAPSSLT